MCYPSCCHIFEFVACLFTFTFTLTRTRTHKLLHSCLSSVVCDSKTDKCLCWCVNIKWNVYACEKFSAARTKFRVLSFFSIFLSVLVCVRAVAIRKTMNKVLEMDLKCNCDWEHGKMWQRNAKCWKTIGWDCITL